MWEENWSGSRRRAVSWLGNWCHPMRSGFAPVPHPARLHQDAARHEALRGNNTFNPRGREKTSKKQNFFRHLVPTPVAEWVAAGTALPRQRQEPEWPPRHALSAAGRMAARPQPSRLYPRKVEMKTLVSRLSVACHQRSGKYRTCGERAGRGGPMGSGSYTLRLPATLGCWLGCVGAPLRPPAGSRDPGWQAGCPGLGWTHLPGAEGALQRPLGRWQRGVRLVEPGQRRLVGVEVGCFIRRVQKPALEDTRGVGTTPISPPAPRAQPWGGGASLSCHTPGLPLGVFFPP